MKKNTTATFLSQDEYQKRMAHYNAWLMSEKPFQGVPYPGFPADVKAGKKVPEPVYTLTAEDIETVKPKAKEVKSKPKPKAKEVKAKPKAKVVKANAKVVKSKNKASPKAKTVKSAPKAKTRVSRTAGKTVAKKSAKKARVVKKQALGASRSKLAQAREIFATHHNLSRDNIIALFMSQLGLSQPSANTYYYNVKKYFAS
jgi:hypothetical protein